jgi:hypothetical protein
VYISPFSTTHNWKLQWTILRSDYKPPGIGELSQKEKEILNTIMSIGVIGGVQLSRYFMGHNKKKAKQMIHSMLRRNLIVQHKFYKDKQLIPIYTVGQHGASLIGHQDSADEWLRYDEKEVLKRLVFFKLYSLFQYLQPKILPAPSPYIGTLQFKDQLLHICVIRDNIHDLLLKLKWGNLRDKFVIVTESLDMLCPLEPHLSGRAVRVTTDHEIIHSSIADMFYEWDADNRKWGKDLSLKTTVPTM